jgi:hypothetical protein
VTNEDAKRFDRELDRGMKMIRASAARLDRERMTADLDILRVALARDLIEPSDFRVASRRPGESAGVAVRSW